MFSNITRTADHANLATAKVAMGKTANMIQDASSRMATGMTTQTYLTTGENCPRIMNLETEIASVENYGQSETTIVSRLEKMEMAARQINDISVEYRARLNAAVSYGVSDTTFQSYCSAKLLEIQNLLNTQDSEGRYLFGGESTVRPPVDMSLMAPPGVGQPLNYAYYKGSNIQTSGMIINDQVMQYGILGNDVAFANLINALSIGVSNAPSNDATTPEYQALVNQAMPMLQNAAGLIPDVLQHIGNDMKLAESSLTQKKESIAIAQEVLGHIMKADYVETMMELTASQVHLQAQFIAYQKTQESIEYLLVAMRNI